MTVTGFGCLQPPPGSGLLSAIYTRGKEIKVPQLPRRGGVPQVRGRQIVVGRLVVIKSRLLSQVIHLAEIKKGIGITGLGQVLPLAFGFFVFAALIILDGVFQRL